MILKIFKSLVFLSLMFIWGCPTPPPPGERCERCKAHAKEEEAPPFKYLVYYDGKNMYGRFFTDDVKVESDGSISFIIGKVDDTISRDYLEKAGDKISLRDNYIVVSRCLIAHEKDEKVEKQ